MKIAVVFLTALSLGGCYGLGLAGAILQGLQSGGTPQSGQVYYVQQQPPRSYTCYQNGPWTNCDAY